MDILQDLHAMHIVQQEAAEPRRKQNFKNRTCAVFSEEMSDFAFLLYFFASETKNKKANFT